MRAADLAGPDALVPTCPDWTVRDLVAHVGGVHRWATSFIRTGRTTPTSLDEDEAFFITVPDDELVDSYRDAHAELLEALRCAEPDTACWTFLSAPSPLIFWARRQAHEASMHCVDAEASIGVPSSFPPDFAVDGITELPRGVLRATGWTPGGRSAPVAGGTSDRQFSQLDDPRWPA